MKVVELTVPTKGPQCAKGCWIDYGSPTLDTPEIRRVAELVTKLYEHPEGVVGGHCHIVTDDWNLAKDHIRFCLRCVRQDRAGKYEHSHNDRGLLDVEEELLRLLLAMPLKERASALAREAGYFEAPA